MDYILQAGTIPCSTIQLRDLHTGDPALYFFFDRVLSFSIMEEVVEENSALLSAKVSHVVECTLLSLMLRRRQ